MKRNLSPLIRQVYLSFNSVRAGYELSGVAGVRREISGLIRAVEQLKSASTLEHLRAKSRGLDAVEKESRTWRPTLALVELIVAEQAMALPRGLDDPDLTACVKTRCDGFRLAYDNSLVSQAIDTWRVRWRARGTVASPRRTNRRSQVGPQTQGETRS
jgi:hypothetical protein